MLWIEDLSIGYAGKAIANGISAEFESSLLVALIGRNGKGKSTLLRTIAGLQSPIKGNIRIGNRNISDLSRKEMATTVGIVLTQMPESLNITVSELVALGRTPYLGMMGKLSADDRSIVEDAIAMVGIATLKDRKLSTLSDGERQKAMIAKTLAQQTDIILLDEPTAFLDFQSKIDLFRLLANLAHDQGKVIILSTHDLNLATRLSDRLWQIDDEPVITDEIKAFL